MWGVVRAVLLMVALPAMCGAFATMGTSSLSGKFGRKGVQSGSKKGYYFKASLGLRGKAMKRGPGRRPILVGLTAEAWNAGVEKEA